MSHFPYFSFFFKFFLHCTFTMVNIKKIACPKGLFIKVDGVKPGCRLLVAMRVIIALCPKTPIIMSKCMSKCMAPNFRILFWRRPEGFRYLYMDL